MYLRKYQESDFHILNNWVTDPDTLFRFSGSAWSYPLSYEQLKKFYQTNPFRFPYLAFSDDNSPVAFGEIISGDSHTPRLGRLLVGNRDSRGKGLGQEFVYIMIKECQKLLDPDKIHLFVLEDNFPAIRCYEKIGFIFDSEVQITETFNGEQKSILLMTLTLK
ncbi:GNAT family N-acetyltransferase [Dyadobacter psychrotolerans]|uniref:N-acetyltransferase n=1 Tax=Dyadobacter psychrotolerans TaxID=2541721 RepID=A0A4R5DYH7_9BACT|nr:GNAT family protein [Dyadobacter psychrotolerans]TDE17550.1 N-acetyltransferase [Dyadobacter psychrotolerans]